MYKMPTDFENKLAGFIESEKLFGPADKILLAVSGGADSTALLYAVCALKAEGAFNGELTCAHINHKLRGSVSDADEQFVITAAHSLNLAIITRRLDVRGFAGKNKLSIETAARQLRIESLLDIAKANNCSRIATAHQKNDNAETVLQRLARGTGFRGLAGIWSMRSFAEGINFVRPLLSVTRAEVVEYLKERNLKWRTDKTNQDCRYRRNYIRHRLMPALQQNCTGSIVEQLFDLSQSARRFYSLICNCADKLWPKLADCSDDKVLLDVKMFLDQHPQVQVELVRRSLITLGSGERNLTQGHYERILQLAEQNIGCRKIGLPDGLTAYSEYGTLIFEKPVTLSKQDKKSIRLEVPGRTGFGDYLIEATVLDVGKYSIEKFKPQKNNFIEWFDFDKVKLPLIVRFRQTGDKFWPLGLADEKRVGKFLTAAKVPQQLRQKILIVADSKKVIWLAPVRISEKTKISEETSKILQLQIIDSGKAQQ